MIYDKNKLRGVVIETTSENEHDLRKFFIDVFGEDEERRWSFFYGECYGYTSDTNLDETCHFGKNKVPPHFMKVSLEEAKEMVKVKDTVDDSTEVPESPTYPKMMWVDGEDEKVWIIGELRGLYVGVEYIYREGDDVADVFTAEDAGRIDELLRQGVIGVLFFENVFDGHFKVGQKRYTKDGRKYPNGEVLEIDENRDVLVQFPTRNEWIGEEYITKCFYTTK